MSNHYNDETCNWCKQDYYIECSCDKAKDLRDTRRREENEAEAFIRKVGKDNGKPYIGLYLHTFKEVADLIRTLRPDLT